MEKVGFADVGEFSKVYLAFDKDLIGILLLFCSPGHNIFLFHHSHMIVTIREVCVLTGLPCTGQDFSGITPVKVVEIPV